MLADYIFAFAKLFQLSDERRGMRLEAVQIIASRYLLFTSQTKEKQSAFIIDKINLNPHIKAVNLVFLQCQP